MKNLSVVVMCIGVFAGCAHTRQGMGQDAGEAALTAQVKTRLMADPDADAIGIDVDTYHGVVTLRGSVENEKKRAAAERVARATDGVKDVDNQLVVTAAEDETGVFSDAWITTKIKSKFAAAGSIAARNIEVDTHDGRVTLSGTVRSQDERDKAISIAKSLEGVKKVDDQTTLASSN
ncbi:MAG: BON domain-containing protein [Myxococcota bacterium]